MKKKGMAYAVLAIVFALINVIAFAVPTEKTSTFWIAYAFTAVAFLAQIVVWQFSFKSDDKLKSKFLGIPIISVGVTYLVIQIIAFAVFLIFPTIPSWIAIIVCAVITGVSAICLIGTDIARKEIDRVEKKVGKKVFYIKSLQIDVEMLAKNEADANIKEALKKLADKIRFSDPMSSEELSCIEAEIAEKVKELKTAENKTAIITVLDSLITERNNKAKLLK